MNEFYLIARIISKGKDGYVKILPHINFKNSFISQLEVYLDFWGKKKKFKIEDVFENRNSVFIKFLNFEGEREVQILMGREVFLSIKDAEKFLKDDLLVENLIGFKIFNGSQPLGTIKGVFKTPANFVLEILSDEQKEILIPYVKNFVEQLDEKGKSIILKKDSFIIDDEN